MQPVAVFLITIETHRYIAESLRYHVTKYKYPQQRYSVAIKKIH